MGTLKIKSGTPLDAMPGLNDLHRMKLRALSISTVEEFLGILQADASCASYLELGSVESLQTDAAPSVRSEFVDAQRRLPDFRPMFGAAPPSDELVAGDTPIDIVDPFMTGAPASGAPTVVHVDLRSRFRPIRAQWQRSTCVAFSCVAVMESLQSTGSSQPDLSEQFVYWAAKQHDGFPQGLGTFIHVAMNVLVQQGVCDESFWPYMPLRNAANEGQGPPPAGTQQAALANRLHGVRILPGKSVAAIKQALDEGKPVALSIPVFESWYANPATLAFGYIPMPRSGSLQTNRGHAMCAVGYLSDDDFTGGGGFIVRNSWGTEWAAHSEFGAGYGVLPFGYVEQKGWEAATFA